VFRASALGLAGIALVLPRLREIAGAELDPVDAEALHAWLVASREGPVVLVLDEADRSVARADARDARAGRSGRLRGIEAGPAARPPAE
jgi:hypothetical protein